MRHSQLNFAVSKVKMFYKLSVNPIFVMCNMILHPLLNLRSYFHLWIEKATFVPELQHMILSADDAILKKAYERRPKRFHACIVVI